MKTKFIFPLLLCVFLSNYTITAQGSLLELANKENEKVADRNEREGRTANNTSNNNYDPTGDQQEYLETWNQILEQQMLNLKEGMSHFNTKETACIFTMVIFLDSYYTLLDEVENTPDSQCEKKSDLLTVLAAATGSSTLIMYCPESIYNMTCLEKQAIHEDLRPLFDNVENDPFIKKWIEKAKRRGLSRDGSGGGWGGCNEIENLCEFFTPGVTITTLINIQQKIEALDCGG